VLAGCGDDPTTPDDADADAVEDTAGDALDDTTVDALIDVTPDVVGDTASVDAEDDTVEDADDTVEDADDTAIEDAADTAEEDTVEDVTDTTEDVDDTAVEDAEDTSVEDGSDTSEPDIDDVEEDETSGAGPFDDLEGMTDDALRAALLDRIDDQTALGYSGDGLAREVMWAVIDAHDGRLECIYTGRTVDAEDPDAPPLGTADLPEIDTTPDHDCQLPDGTSSGCFFNAEHSWPRSQGADSGPAESDLHHLFPAYDMANNRRSSYAFGETDCTGNACEWHEGGSELGERPDGTKVFQVRGKYQGDIARAQFYFAVRYAKNIEPIVEATLRDWHAADPVSDEERARNDAIEEWQGNRNPFVDRPDFVDAIANF